MGELFGRRVAVDIGTAGAAGQRIEGLRIVVRAKRTRSGAADPATVSVYNGPSDVLGRLQDDGVVTRVLAGYGEQLTQLVYGSTVRGSLRGPERQGADLVTTWQVHDGGTLYQTAAVLRGWIGDTLASEIVQTVADDAGLPVASLTLGEDVTFPRSYFASGTLPQVLDDLAGATGSTWTIIGGRLYMWPTGQVRATTAMVLGYGSGLIEPPVKVDAKRWRVRSLLMPGALPGERYIVQADQGGGRYIAEDVETEIDSLGYGPFTTTITGVADGR